MEVLDLGSDVKKTIKINGVDYIISEPTLELAEELSEKISLPENEGKQTKLMKDYLSALGLPYDVSNKLTINQFTKLVDWLNSKKK